MIAFSIFGMAYGIAALVVDDADYKRILFVGYAVALAVACLCGHLISFGLGLIIGPILFVAVCVLISAWAFSGIEL